MKTNKHKLGAVNVNIPLLCEDVQLVGRLRFKILLVDHYPFVKNISICFLTDPVVDLVIKPGGKSKRERERERERDR